MNTRNSVRLLQPVLGSIALATLLGLAGCESSGYDTHTSVSVGYGYGGYYDPYYGPGYYAPYPPVVVVPPDGERPPPGERPPSSGGNRPTTLPADVGGPSTRPSTMPPPRPSASSRPTSRPAPRPAPRPMPRGGGMRR